MRQPVKLFCVPYSGGSATLYLRWKEFLNDSVELHPLELRGRGKRFIEPLYESMSEAVSDLYENIKPHLNGSPYVLFGHSLGGILVYELAQLIRQKGDNMPLMLIPSGRRPPSQLSGKKRHLLSDEEFKQELFSMGGTPKEILEHAELLELFLPILRADFKLADTYVHDKSQPKLDTDVVVLNGTEDDLVNAELLPEWSEYALGKMSIHHFEGGHFFLHDHAESICQLIQQLVADKQGVIR
ncbi:thioesterase II family protein [Brevibacillus dissolubilis]|uniref:thioesterase II family protein n=1 Tax=Brevibacillus dissolubilis TaxID=1844116 RepID=UPI001117AADA|nr:alpha/beta fold hydrolase [Brevibacillus dissolubilis]